MRGVGVADADDFERASLNRFADGDDFDEPIGSNASNEAFKIAQGIGLHAGDVKRIGVHVDVDFDCVVRGFFGGNDIPAFPVGGEVTVGSIRDGRAEFAVPDIVEVLQDQGQVGARFCLQLKIPVAVGAIWTAAFVVVYQVDDNGAVRVDLPKQRGSIFKSGVDKVEIRLNLCKGDKDPEQAQQFYNMFHLHTLFATQETVTTRPWGFTSIIQEMIQ